MNEGAPSRSPNPIVRAALWFVGVLATVLGVLGAFLPLLPTTPFLLLAAACFARSSPRFYRLLLENRLVGPYLRQWREERTIPRRAKRKAYVIVLSTFSVSAYLVEETAPRILLLVLGLGLLGFLRRLPVAERERA